MRRLPVFFLLDVSESMVGEPLQQLEDGLEQIVSVLRQDPHSLETVYISLIAFAGQARALNPLIDLVSFYPPKIPVGGGTALGAGLDVLMDEIDSKVKKTTYEQRGDWEPVVFLITDGKPTDDPQPALERWRQHYASRASLIAVTLGNNADMHVLRALTDHVLALENSGTNEYHRFIDWVSASVRAQSQKIEIEGKTGGVSLQKAGAAGLTVVDDANAFVCADPDYVVLTGKCAKTRKPYLLKYSRTQTEGIEFIKTQHFGLEGAFALDNSYFDWSSDNATLAEQVNTSLLDGVAPCPHCGNGSSFAMCGCGHLLCLDRTGLATCPWCSTALQFDMSAGGQDFDVTRGQG